MGAPWSPKSKWIGIFLTAVFLLDWLPAIIFNLVLEPEGAPFKFICSLRELSALMLLRTFPALFAVGLRQLRGTGRMLVYIVQARILRFASYLQMRYFACCFVFF